MTKDDYNYLKTISVRWEEYNHITDDFNLRHGIELIDNRIGFYGYPTAIHEHLNRRMDGWVGEVYGRNIMKLGSMSNIISESGI
jgi:hypothetical protein